MKNSLSVLSAALCLFVGIVRGADSAKNLSGSWQGTLDAGAAKLRVAFNITQAADGKLSATMDSLDQGARGIPVDQVALTDDVIVMEVKAVRGEFRGKVDAAGQGITGQWRQGPNALPLNLNRGKAGDSISESEILSATDLAASKEAGQRIVGVWNGTLATGAGSLRLRLNIMKGDNGAATGTLDSLDQGAIGLPLSVITLREGKVRFEVRGVGGVYEGIVAAAGTELSGQWLQGGHSQPLDFKKK